MAICDHLAPNGEKSILYQQLEQKYGDEKAHDMWTAIRTQQFLNEHGDWTELDENKEPTLPWVEEKLQPQVPTPAAKPEFTRNLEPDKPKKGQITPPTEMAQKVQTIYTEAVNNPDNTYKIDYEHLSNTHRFPSGYTGKELANFFYSLPIPENIRFTDSFYNVLANTTGRIVEELGSDAPTELINRDEVAIHEYMGQVLVAKMDGAGSVQGIFDSVQQKEIVDGIAAGVSKLLRQDPYKGANALISMMYMVSQKALTSPDENFRYIDRQREKFADLTLRRLKDFGLSITDKDKATILKAVRLLKPMTEEFKAALTEKGIEVNEGTDPATGEFIESTGRGLRDWNDVSFELDPKDTASSRIKMYIASMPDIDRTVFKVSPDAEVKLNPAEIKVGNSTLEYLIHSKGIEKAMYEWKNTDNAGVQKLVNDVNRKNLWMENEAVSKGLASFLATNYPMVPKTNFLGWNKMADFETTFQDMLTELAGQERTDFNSMLSTMDNSGKPVLQYISQQLKNTDEQMQNEFTKVMRKQYAQYSILLFNPKVDTNGNTTWNGRLINANRYNQRDTLIKNWREQQKLSPVIKINEQGERVVDVQRIRTRWLPMLEYGKSLSIDDWANPKNIEWAKKSMGNILIASGIEFTPDMVNYLFRNMEKVTKGTNFPGGIERQFSVTKDGRPNGMFSAFILKSAGMSDVYDTGEDLSEDDLVKRSELNNPLYTENGKGGVIQILAKIAQRFTPSLQNSNHRSSEGKNVFDFVQHTKLSYKFLDFQNNFDAFKAKLSKVDIARDSWLLKAPAPDVRLRYLDGLQAKKGKHGTTRSDMSDREQMFYVLQAFQNQGNGFNKVPKVAYISLTHSDKTTTPVFENMPHVNVGIKDGYSSGVIGNMTSAMYNVFRSEHQRIINQKDIDFNNAQYNKGKSLFYFIPDFNYDGMKKLVGKGVITQAEMNKIWQGGQRDLTKTIRDDIELPVINKVLKNFMDGMVKGTIDKWASLKLTTDDSLPFDEKYIKKVLAAHDIHVNRGTDATTYADNTGKLVPYENIHKALVNYAAKDFAINYFLFNTSLSQLFYGDPAQAYKASKKGTTDLDHVDSTMKEYAKRLAKDIAPGQDPYWQPTDKNYTQLILKDVKPAEKYLENYKSLAKPYGEVEGTDAQELTTIAESLKVKYAMGLVPKKVFDEMAAIVTKAKGGYYEFTNPEHLKIIMQPDKPVYTGTNDVPVNGALLDTYIKSSSYPLYPPLTAGTEIEHLRTLMEKEGIARTAFASAVKLGNPTQPADLFSSDGTFKQDYDKDQFKNAQQVLNRDNFRIQQEVPYDEEKEKIRTVSQENKLITESIQHIDNFQIPGREGTMTGTEVRALKEEVRKQMIVMKSKDNTIINGSEQDIYDNLAEQATKKGYTLNERQGLLIRDNKGKLEIPLMFNPAADRFESLLMSGLNDVVNIKMPGKSFVQASSVGYNFKKTFAPGTKGVDESSIDKSKVVWIEGYDGSPLKTLRNEDSTVKAAQVLVPFNFTKADGTKARIEDYMTEKDGKRYLDEAKVPKELIQYIGARIPNQGHNSMLPIEVAGFIPSEMGDLVVVPSAITKQMGADFDVDKLYTYKRAYVHDPKTDSFSVDTPPTREQHRVKFLRDWEGKEGSDEDLLTTSQSPEIEQAIDADYTSNTTGLQNKSMAHLQNEYFNIHWGVLTHPDMVEKVLRPLDKVDLKNESELLGTKDSEVNAYHVLNQLEDFQRGKDAKALVGMTSLSVTFNAVIQDKNLYLYKTESFQDEEGNTKSRPVRDFIVMKDEHTGKELKLTNLSGFGISNYTEKDGEILKETDSRTKTDNQTTIQSAAVDNAKDRTLDNLNITTATYRAADAMMQLETEDGQALNLKYITRLLTQPIIREFNSRMKSDNDSLSDKYTKNLKESLFDGLQREYLSKAKEADKVNSLRGSIQFDPQTLLKAQAMEGDEGIAHQLAALDLFKRFDEIGTRKAELQSLANGDVNGAGPNLLSSLDKEEKATNMEQVPIKNADSIFGTAGMFSNTGRATEQGTIFTHTTMAANSIITKYLPYDAYTGLFDTMRKISNRVNISVDQQRTIMRGIRSFTYTTGTHWWKDAQADRIRLMYGREGEPSLAQRVIDARNTWGKDNYLLSRLDPRIGTSTEEPDFLEYQAATTARQDEEQNTRAWLDMLMSKDDSQRRMGEDLLRYAILTGGIQDANSFVKYIPTNYIASTEFGDMLKQKEQFIKDGTDEVCNPGFIEQYYQHNPAQAQQVEKTFLQVPKDAVYDYPETFRVGSAETMPEEIINEDGVPVKYLSYYSKRENQWILYTSNAQGNDLYYTRIDTLGNKYSDEYNGQADTAQRSIFTENRSLSSGVPRANADRQVQNLKMQHYRNYDNNATPFDRIAVKEGGPEQVQAALENIIHNPLVPEHLRVTARVMNTVPDIAGKFREGITGLAQAGYKPNIRFDTTQQERGAHQFDGTITINPSRADNIDQAAEIFTHEIVHSKLANIITASGYDSRLEEMKGTLDPNARNVINTLQDKFQKANPVVMAHIKELDRIRYEALTELRNRLGDKYQGLKDDIASGDSKRITTANHTLVYALDSLQEMVAHVGTNTDVANFLNSVQSSKKQGNLFDRIVGTIARLFRELADSFGFKVKDNSLLEQALYHTVAMSSGDIPEDRDFTRALVNHSIMYTKTEDEARSLQNLTQENYGYQADITNNLVNYSIGVTRKIHSVPGQVGKVLNKLYKQLDDAGYAISNARNDAERIALGIRYSALKEDINTLSRERDLKLVAGVGNRQMQWIDKVLANPAPSATDVFAAIETTNIWSGLIDLMYGGNENINSSNPEFDSLQATAIKKRIELLNRKSLPVVNELLSGTSTILTRKDMTSNLTELNNASANFLNLSRVKPLLIQAIAHIGMQAANNSDEEYGRTIKKLNSIFKRMQSAGLKDDYFLQKDSWGLVHRLSGEWYQFQKESRNRLDMTLDSIDRTDKLTDEARKDRYASAWNRYWTDLRSNAVFADTRKLFDFKTGDKLQGEGYDKAVADLTKNVGSEEYAKELIEKAHEKFKQYIQEKDIARQHIEDTTELSAGEKAGRTQEEQDKLLVERKKAEFEKWINYNSPNEFLNKMNGKGDLKYINNGDRWTAMAPRAEQSKFYDPRYQDIQKNPQALGIYQDYKNIIQEMVSYLPAGERAKLSEDFLPIISKDIISSLATTLGKIRNWDTSILNAFTATEGEEAARLKPDKIPINYTRETNGTKDIANRSTDIIRLAELFSRMALHYKHMAPVLDHINVAEAIVKEANRQRVSGEDDGKPLKHALDAIKYFKDALLFQKPQELQGKIDNPIYSLNPAKQVRIQHEITDLIVKRKELEDEIEKQLDEGNFQTEEQDKQIDDINKKLDEYEKNARHIYGSKAVNALVGLNQLKVIGYNPVSAFSNFTFGMISVNIHANGRTDFSQADLGWAMSKMRASMQKYYTFGTIQNEDADKIFSLMERTGVMTELSTGSTHSLLEVKQPSHLKKAFSPMNWQVSGDFYAKGAMMLAMLKHKMVDVTGTDGAAQKISLWDALDKDGNWNEKLYGQRKEWYSDNLNEQKEWNNYRDKMRKVAVMVFGNQDKNAPLMAKKNWLIRLAGQFRMSWFPEGLAARFQEGRDDIQLGRGTKGRWVTYKDLGFFTSAAIMANQLLSAIPGVNRSPFEGRTDKQGNPISEVDIDNMRRNFAGLAWTVGFTATILALRALYEDDHKKGTKASNDAHTRQLLINLLIRNQQDLTLYSSPSVLNTVSGNLLPATGVITDAIAALKASGTYMMNDGTDKHAFDKWSTKVTRSLPYLNLYPKMKYMLTRDLDAVTR